MVENGVIPKEIFDELGVKETKPFEKEVKIIFDKKQAMIRFPTVLGQTLNLKEGDRCRLSVDSSAGVDKIVCEIIRKK